MDRHEDPAPTRSQPGLLDRAHGVIRRLHYNYSIPTERVNVDWFRRFILFHGKRHPAEMGAPEGAVSPCSRIGSAGPSPFTGSFHLAVTAEDK